MAASVRKFEEMKDVLMDPNSCRGSLNPYYVVKSPGNNITILPPILFGKEFNKTYGHYHKPHFPEKYTLLYGEGGFLIQKLKDLNDYYGEIGEVIFTRLEMGKEFLIPKGFGHCLINLGNDLLITRDNWDDKNADHEYKAIEAKRGMGYYAVKGKRGNVEFVPNPNYSNLPKVRVVELTI